jgi:hypothetical protein
MKSTLRKYAFLPVLLVLAIGGGLLMRSKTGSQASEAAERAAQRADTSTTTQVANAGGAAIATDILQAPRINGGHHPETSAERRQLLETIGTLTAAHSYQTYLNIEFVANGKAKATYTDDQAYRLLDLILSLLDSVDRNLTILGKMELGAEDRASLQQVRDLSDLLYRQAKQLETFWHSGKDEDAARYEELRKDSWAAIKKFTGVDQESGKAGE